MTDCISPAPGVNLRVFHSEIFKHGCLSIQYLRPMCSREAAKNALIPAVLLRGTVNAPDLRAVTDRLDDLYGASVGALVRRIGDYQTTGIYCSFLEDRYALPGDRVLENMVSFARELLTQPLTERGVFSSSFVESEKHNLISTIQSNLNDKRAYADAKLRELMCGNDSYGVPRLGKSEDVEAITPESLFAHYQTILRESPVEVFYVGSAPIETVARLLAPLFADRTAAPAALPGHKPFVPDCPPADHTETMDIAQGKLAMGFVTDITNQSPLFPAMQLLNAVYGSGMTSKLFMNVREKLSLCYAVHSAYYSAKGILTVSAGIETEKGDVARAEILHQLELCKLGQITEAELESGRQAILSSLRGITDSPGAIENYCSVSALSGLPYTLDSYAEAIRAVTAADVAKAAQSLRLQTTFFLKGGAA